MSQAQQRRVQRRNVCNAGCAKVGRAPPSSRAAANVWQAKRPSDGRKVKPVISSVFWSYLQTFEHRGGYLIYLAGITRRPAPARFREHTRKYLNGDYNVLDVDAAQQGRRQEVWHGWGYARAHREEFEARKQEIREAVHRQLAGFRIFVADVGDGPRLLERLEAAIMGYLYQQPPPICEIPDKGMFLAARRPAEPPITVRSVCSVVLHGLPACLEV